MQIVRKNLAFSLALLKRLHKFDKRILDFSAHKEHLPAWLKRFPNLFWDRITDDYIDYKRNEDSFWSFEAKKLYPDFKIAPVEIAVSFSFETGPRYCFEKNNHCLPFGCHGWTQYDREFWQPYLLK